MSGLVPYAPLGGVTGGTLVCLAAQLKERDLRLRVLEAIKLAGEILHSDDEEEWGEGKYGDVDNNKLFESIKEGGRHLYGVRMESKEYNKKTGFEEPQDVIINSKSRCEYMIIGTGSFQDLQELYACVLLGHSWKDFVHSKQQDKDGALNQTSSFVELAMQSIDDIGRESHLLCHASEGLYLPVQDCGAPVFDQSGTAPGGWVGSSVQLLSELVELCPILNISLRPLRGAVRRGGGFDISPESLESLHIRCARIANRSEKDYLMYKDDSELELSDAVAHTWFVLFEAARLSKEFGTSLVLLAR